MSGTSAGSAGSPRTGQQPVPKPAEYPPKSPCLPARYTKRTSLLLLQDIIFLNLSQMSSFPVTVARPRLVRRVRATATTLSDPPSSDLPQPQMSSASPLIRRTNVFGPGLHDDRQRPRQAALPLGETTNAVTRQVRVLLALVFLTHPIGSSIRLQVTKISLSRRSLASVVSRTWIPPASL